MATHSSMLAWRRSLVDYSQLGRKKSDTTEHARTQIYNTKNIYVFVVITKVNTFDKLPTL